MEVTLHRKYQLKNYTVGHLYINNEYYCDTIEDADRGLQQSMPLSDIKAKKIYGKTAIPAGTYNLGFTFSNKFHSRTWAAKYEGKVISIDNVKGYEGVRIHPLNTAEDSYGCVGLGENKVKGKVLNSTKYYLDFLQNHYLPAISKGDTVTLTIIN